MAPRAMMYNDWQQECYSFVGAGDDLVTSGSGNDVINIGSGADVTDTGSNDDTIYLC